MNDASSSTIVMGGMPPGKGAMSTGGFAEWANSVMLSPVPIQYALVPLSEIAESVAEPCAAPSAAVAVAASAAEAAVPTDAADVGGGHRAVPPRPGQGVPPPPVQDDDRRGEGGGTAVLRVVRVRLRGQVPDEGDEGNLLEVHGYLLLPVDDQRPRGCVGEGRDLPALGTATAAATTTALTHQLFDVNLLSRQWVRTAAGSFAGRPPLCLSRCTQPPRG